MWATLVLVLGLPLALATESPSCAPLVAATFDNATVPRFLGKWYYIGTASKYAPFLEWLRAVTFGVFFFSLGSHEAELYVTETLRRNETCVAINSSKVQFFWENSTLMHVNNDQVSMATLIQSHQDLLITSHVNSNFPGVSISARTHNVSKEHMDEFKAQLHCLGFTDEDVFYTSSEHACPLPWEETGEENADPEQG